MTAVLAVNTLVAIADNALDGFAYNRETNEQQQVTSATVYKVDDGSYLKRHMRYNYAYDEAGRVTTKEALQWNSSVNDYCPAYRLDIDYTEEGVALQYARWDIEAGAYAAASERTLYRSTPGGVDYLSYEWSEQSGEWDLQLEHNFGAGQLLAVD